MKITPISGDLILKTAIAAAAVFALAYLAKKGLGSLWGAPGQLIDNITQAAKQGGAQWQDNYKPNNPSIAAMTGNTYSGPLVNNDGYDFGQLSG